MDQNVHESSERKQELTLIAATSTWSPRYISIQLKQVWLRYHRGRGVQFRVSVKLHFFFVKQILKKNARNSWLGRGTNMSEVLEMDAHERGPRNGRT